ncbi:MAG: hypothetical protein ACD_75C01985G0003 [uncultured bacterium]|nr:MAG: hypothetical protein ACD_75C01985G0003 [uncultured bacterium]
MGAEKTDVQQAENHPAEQRITLRNTSITIEEITGKH